MRIHSVRDDVGEGLVCNIKEIDVAPVVRVSYIPFFEYGVRLHLVYSSGIGVPYQIKIRSSKTNLTGLGLRSLYRSYSSVYSAYFLHI